MNMLDITRLFFLQKSSQGLCLNRLLISGMNTLLADSESTKNICFRLASSRPQQADLKATMLEQSKAKLPTN
jgi:hypothetical protein